MAPLIAGAVRAALVLAVAWLALRLTRGQSASLRRLVLVVALSGALVAPLVSLALAHTKAATFASIAIDGVPLLDLGADREFPRLSAADALVSSPEPAPVVAMTSGSWSQHWLTITGFVWAVGTLLFLFRLATARIALGRLLRGARPATQDFRRLIAESEAALGVRARVLVSESIDVPLTAGVLEPVIVLPSDAASWPEQRWVVAMRHELAHVRHRDALAQLIAEIACAVHFFNPLVWWARHQLEVERELAADERVVHSGVSASSYAAELLRVAAERSGIDRVPRAALGVLRHSGLSERVERLAITGARLLPSRTRRVSVIASGSALVFLVACASLERTGVSPPAERSAAAGEPVPDELSNEVAAALGTRASRVELTIDPRIQRIAQLETRREIEQFAATTATVIVIDPSTGSVLAITNPRTATANYAPGSTLKTLTIAAALDDGKLSPDQTFDCGMGYFANTTTALGFEIWGTHGVLSVSQILARSSNVGMSWIYDRLGGASFARWFNRFHLDEAPPIELQSAAPGSAAGVEDEPSGSIAGAIAAIGQGVATSPLHMAALYAAVANDGVYLAPTLVRAKRDDGGNVVWRHEPKPERLLRPETARTLLRLLVGAVEDEQATGRAARLDGVSVAGKTGSAQVKPLSPIVREGDAPSYASFIGIVPAAAPRYVILVGVEGSKPGATGGKVAAPAFARIARQMLALR